MSTDALLDKFEEICLVESELQHSMFEEGVKKYNECQHALWDVRDQLKARAPDARLMLSRFYGHYNPHVRLKAAKLSYRIAPGPARRVFEELATMKPLDEAFDAAMCLSMIDDGRSMLS